MLADPLHLSRHQRTPSTPPLSSSFLSSKLQTSNPCNHRNQQYSIIGLTNAAGTLVERYSYTAYGTLGIYDASGTVRTTSTYANRYTYTGREYDADLNLYHFRALWYDPTTGGFISRDPLGYVDGMSLYRGYFAPNNQDPSGNIEVTTPGGKDGGKTNCKTKGHDCGDELKASWYFTLHNGKASCKGWLVQKVTIKCELKKCIYNIDLPAIMVPCGFGWMQVDLKRPEQETENYTYYEAWRIELGEEKPKGSKSVSVR